MHYCKPHTYTCTCIVFTSATLWITDYILFLCIIDRCFVAIFIFKWRPSWLKKSQNGLRLLMRKCAYSLMRVLHVISNDKCQTQNMDNNNYWFKQSLNILNNQYHNNVLNLHTYMCAIKNTLILYLCHNELASLNVLFLW